MTDAQFFTKLDAYLASEGITRFRARELCPVGKRANGRGPSLQQAPERLWGNAVKTLRVLEALRPVSGPIHVLSGYRDPAYNLAVGGEEESLHMAFSAFDVVPRDLDLKSFALLADRRPESRDLGIGLYVGQGFVHVDSRGMIGRRAPARWGTPLDWWKAS